MTKTTLKHAGSMAAAIAVATAFTGAHATTTALYSGGSTLAEKVYRDIFNQYGSTDTQTLCFGLPSTYCATTPYNANVEALYVGVGSGNGKSALNSYNPSNYVAGPRTPDNPPVASGKTFGPYFGTGSGSTWVPGTANPFPTVSFSGSDDPLNSTDVFAYGNKFGPLIQFPSLVTPVAIPFTPTASEQFPWNPQGKQPAGGSSKVDLSTNSICGIFSGAIADWSNASITKDNKNKVLGSGTIVVVYRNDGSGTTFLTSNALLNQCGSSKYPISTNSIPEQWLIDAAVTDKNGATVTSSSDAGPPYTSTDTFFIAVFKAAHLPSNFYNNLGFAGVSGGCKGSGGVQLCVDATVGAIGYISPDFVQPVILQGTNDKDGNPVAATANIQTYASYHNKTTAIYEPPTAKAANFIMQTATPPSFTGGATAPATNPLNWGATNPTPTAAAAYPIGGFTFIDMYSCYHSATTLAALVGRTAGSLGLWTWYEGTSAQNASVPETTLSANGFNVVPTAWTAAIKTLLETNIYTRIGTPKEKNTACASVANGA